MHRVQQQARFKPTESLLSLVVWGMYVHIGCQGLRLLRHQCCCLRRYAMLGTIAKLLVTASFGAGQPHKLWQVGTCCNNICDPGDAHTNVPQV